MVLIHTSEDRIYLYHLKNLLETAGLESIIKNDGLSSISGEIPMMMCWPELWLINDTKIELANKIISESQQQVETTGKTWICDLCGEKHSSQFSDCWNCNGRITKAF